MPNSQAPGSLAKSDGGEGPPPGVYASLYRCHSAFMRELRLRSVSHVFRATWIGMQTRPVAAEARATEVQPVPSAHDSGPNTEFSPGSDRYTCGASRNCRLVLPSARGTGSPARPFCSVTGWAADAR